MITALPTYVSRSDFVLATSESLGRAGVEHVFLHNTDDSNRDSDLDILIARSGLSATDALLRSGALGRLLQRVDYEIPWCRCYVVETGDPARPFRQLDVACDPYGISRCGPALRIALDHSVEVNGLRVLDPAMTVVYLACKRAIKGVRDDYDLDQLRRPFMVDTRAATQLLRAIFGERGDALAEDLADPSARVCLDGIRRSVASRRRRPVSFVRRAGFETRRRVGRVVHPTGLIVAFAGPDGTGKTTLADALASSALGLFHRVERRHLGPGLFPSPGRMLRREPADITRPHARTPSGRAGSLARICWLAADNALGWWPRMTVPRIRFGLVLLERGWCDLLVDPRRYRLSAGEHLVRALKWLLPRPNLTFLLNDRSQRIHARKPELPSAEIERQLATWKELLAGDRRARELEVADPDTTASRALTTICDELARRVSDLSGFRAALTCFGSPKVGGRRYSLLSARGSPRWIVPRAIGARGPRGTGLYRPASVRHALGVLAIEARQRLGGAAWPALELDDSDGLLPEIAAALDLPQVEVAALLPTDPRRGSRTVLAVLVRNRPIAIAKVAPVGSPELEQERRALSALETASLKTLVVPRPLASFVWRNFDVLITTRVPLHGRTDRPLRHAEELVMVELANLRDRLAPAFGGNGDVPVHGDFCGWNSSVLRGGRLSLWDWEWAHMGEPLEDWFHWQTQRLIHFGHGSVEELVQSALEPSKCLRDLCSRLNLDPTATPRGLAASLRHGLATSSPEENGADRAVRKRALAALEGAL